MIDTTTQISSVKLDGQSIPLKSGGTELPAYMSAKNFTFDGNACTGYVGDNSLPQIIIPQSYSISSDGSFVDGNDYQVTAITKAGNGFDNYGGKIILLNNITSIGDNVFWGANLNSLVIPSSVNSVGSYFIYDCPNITDILLMANITSIPQEAFSFCPLLKNINIPDTVTEIGSASFIMCASFTSISIPESVTSIGAAAFAGCSLLQSINVSPNNQFYMTESGVLFDKAQTTLLLYPAGKLDKTYIVPNGVTSISAAFAFCANIQLVELPSTVTSIEDSAFSGCSNLTTVRINATIPPTIQSTTFDNTVERYEVPAESVETYKTATNWSTYADKIFAIE